MKTIVLLALAASLVGGCAHMREVQRNRDDWTNHLQQVQVSFDQGGEITDMRCWFDWGTMPLTSWERVGDRKWRFVKHEGVVVVVTLDNPIALEAALAAKDEARVQAISADIRIYVDVFADNEPAKSITLVPVPVTSSRDAKLSFGGVVAKYKNPG